MVAPADYLRGRTDPEQGDHAFVNGVHIWYHDTAGDGIPLVLVGGFTAGHFVFDFARPSLADFRLITWEPRGLGRSDCPDPATHPYSAEVWAEDLHQLLNHLGIDRVAVWAAGFGSYIAFRLAAEHPKLVDALVTYTDVWAGDESKGYERIWPVYRAIVESFGTEGFGARVLANIFGLWDVPWFLDWEARNVEETLHPETVRATVGYGLLDADVRADLARVRASVLVLLGNGTWEGGVADVESDPSLALIRQEISHVELEVVEGAHPGYVPVQDPERCATAVKGFVEARFAD